MAECWVQLKFMQTKNRRDLFENRFGKKEENGIFKRNTQIVCIEQNLPEREWNQFSKSDRVIQI